MAYRPQLFFVKDQEYDFIGEGKNAIPLFWSLLFSKNQYTVTAKEELYFPSLTIDHQHLLIPNYDFDGEAARCWNDFADAIRKKAAEGYDLSLDLADILMSATDVDTLKTLEDVRAACHTLLQEMTDYAFSLIDQNSLSYGVLLGMSNLPEVSEDKYPGLNMITKPDSQIPGITKKKSKARIIIEMIITSIISLLILFYCFALVISGEQIILGLLGILLFGVGTIFYVVRSIDSLH